VSGAVVLDSTPLGILCHPRSPPHVLACRQWLADLLAAGRRVIVPEIADYEIRRELIRLGGMTALANLDGYGLHRALSRGLVFPELRRHGERRERHSPSAQMRGTAMFARWRRMILIAVAILAVAAGGTVGTVYYLRAEAQRELDEVIALVDSVDKRWRLEDVEADRRHVPPEENSALLIVAAQALLPNGWYLQPSIWDGFEKIAPPVELGADQAAALTAELERVRPALEKAREIKDRSFGHHRLEYKPDWLGTLVVDQQNTRDVGKLLEMDAWDCVHRKNGVQAWESHRALLNTARSLGDEPLLISMLVRMALDQMAVHSLERALGQGALPPAQLEERQHAVEAERTEPLFLNGMRGERAGNDFMLTNIETGRIGLLETLENAGRANIHSVERTRAWDRLNEFFAYSMVLRSHATLLRYQTEMVEAAKLPPQERYRALAEIDASFYGEIPVGDRSQIMARLLFPNVIKVADAEQRICTNLGCAVAALAVERFRLSRGRWPASLNQVVEAGLLDKVPIDLFDGNALRFRRTADGVVIYSIGKDGGYDGTGVDNVQHWVSTPMRVEFRLWDPERRRQPAAPAPKPDECP
jgi:hypothetical protein